MKIFISHPVKDEDLANKLKTILEQADEIDEAYIAQKIKKYETEISKKIIDQIDSSDYVVGLITINAKASASVNQELGYAQGKNKPRIPMIEKKAKKGVLIYGKDDEEFDRENFEEIWKKVRDHIINNKPKKITKTTPKDSDVFLINRGIGDPESPSFGSNKIIEKISTRVEQELEVDGKSHVLFSVCPHHLIERIDITSSALKDWIKDHVDVQLESLRTPCVPRKRKIGLDNIVYYDDPTGEEKFYKYLEINRNGFIEQGFTVPLIWSWKYTDKNLAWLQLCFLTGAFWAFLKFCKNLFDHLQFEEKFDVFLSITNSQNLVLRGFGGTTRRGVWAEPESIYGEGKFPTTEIKNIGLTIPSITKDSLTDDYIKKQARMMSDRISNAYGIETSRCYNLDGSFNFKLFQDYLMAFS